MAVYTTFPREALDAFLRLYEIGSALSCEAIAEGVENSNFLLDTTQGRFILTLYERRVREAELPYFLGLMHYLAERDIVCPTPVASRGGDPLTRLADRPAAITTFLQGRPAVTVGAAECHAVGAALASLHRAGQDFPLQRANDLGPAAWAPLLAACHDAGDERSPGLTAMVAEAIAQITAAWPAPGSLPVGQIHADLFPDNVFFQDDRLSGLIDFYFACTDFLAYDLAICLNAWCFPDEAEVDAALIAAMCAGYETVRPLTDAERAALPLLCQGAALRFLLTRLYDWVNTPAGALVTRKDPLAYEARLRVWRRAGGALIHG